MTFEGKLGLSDVNILIDSGATHSFINKKVVDKLGLKPCKLSKSRNVSLADPSSKLVTTGFLSLVDMEIDDFYWTQTRLFIIDGIDNDEIILGMDWLRAHNPNFDWNKNFGWVTKNNETIYFGTKNIDRQQRLK